MKKILSLVSVFVLTMVSPSHGNLPPGVSACNARDYACMAATTDNIIENYYGGNADLDVISFDPLIFHEMVWENATLNEWLLLSNTKQFNYRGFRVTSMSGFGENLAGPHQIKILTPNSTLFANYTINGTILGYPVNASDIFTLFVEHMEFTINFTGTPWLQNGENYLNVTDFAFDYSLKRAEFNMSNLVPGNQTQSEFLLNMINDNSLQVLNNWSLSINNVYGPRLEEIISRALRSTPYSALVIGGI